MRRRVPETALTGHEPRDVGVRPQHAVDAHADWGLIRKRVLEAREGPGAAQLTAWHAVAVSHACIAHASLLRDAPLPQSNGKRRAQRLGARRAGNRALQAIGDTEGADSTRRALRAACRVFERPRRTRQTPVGSFSKKATPAHALLDARRPRQRCFIHTAQETCSHVVLVVYSLLLVRARRARFTVSSAGVKHASAADAGVDCRRRRRRRRVRRTTAARCRAGQVLVCVLRARLARRSIQGGVLLKVSSATDALGAPLCRKRLRVLQTLDTGNGTKHARVRSASAGCAWSVVCDVLVPTQRTLRARTAMLVEPRVAKTGVFRMTPAGGRRVVTTGSARRSSLRCVRVHSAFNARGASWCVFVFSRCACHARSPVLSSVTGIADTIAQIHRALS